MVKKIADGGGYSQHWTYAMLLLHRREISYGMSRLVHNQTLMKNRCQTLTSVQVMNLDGSNQQTFASGLRNELV